MSQAISENQFLKNVDRSAYELGTLLRSLPALDSGVRTNDQRLMANAAEIHAGNGQTAVLSGIQAIGKLLMTAALNDQGEISSRTAVDLGALIEHLGVELEFLLDIECAMKQAGGSK